MTKIDVTQGVSLSLALRLAPVVNGAAVTDLTGWTIASQVRRADGSLIATLTAEFIDPTQCTARLTSPTADWPLARLRCDVLVTGPGGAPMVFSPPFDLVVAKPVTQVP